MKVTKSMIVFFAAFAMTVTTLSSCSDDNGSGETKPTDPDVSYVGGVAQSSGILFKEGKQIGNGDKEFVFTGKQTIKKGTYLLKGFVYVAKGAELTVEAGTIIKGDKETKGTLIIEPGGKAFMAGTANAPIVMTSEKLPGQRRPGDWGGLIVCGNARNNQGTQQIEGGPRTIHGGDNDNDNSGIFQYIRVEFAGNPFAVDKEINGVTFGSVGKNTTVDHIQVSYSNDDSFEWFGGSVNCKYLVAYKGWDDDFDTDNGFSGHVQFGLAVRDPRIADTSQSNGFESDNCADGATVSPYTNAVFSNITFIGPKTAKNSDFINKSSYITGGDMYPDNGSKLGLFQSAMQIRRSSRLSCYNSVAVGFPVGLIIDGEKGSTVDYAKGGLFHLKNIIFAGMDAVGSDNNKKYEDQYYDKATGSYDATRKSYSNTFFFSEGNRTMNESDLNLVDGAINTVGQNYLPSAGSPLLSGASFAGVTSSFLNTTVSYLGAFSGVNDNWLNSWTNFDPQNTVY